MKIIVFGGRGDVGRRIVAEAERRGHQVSVVVRSASQLEALPPELNGVVADVANTKKITELMAQHDLAISAVRPPDGGEEALVPLTRSVLDAAAEAGIRVLIVGGAASLKMPDQSDTTVLTADGFLPTSVVPIARASNAQYEMLTDENEANWAYLCPPAQLQPGARTGTYRVGSDRLLVDSAGSSKISMEDFAVAMMDEAEVPQHRMARFTVAY
ncbi:MAG: NAD(P)H-binding protein [Pseudomonadota bacterium]